MCSFKKKRFSFSFISFILSLTQTTKADKVKDVDKKAIFPQVMEIEPYLDLFLDFLAEKEIEWLGRLWLALQKVLRSDEIDGFFFLKFFSKERGGEREKRKLKEGKL